MTTQTEFQAGTVLGGRFRVTGTLGRGAYGSVYACDDLREGDRAAVKVLHRAVGRPLGRFYMEYRALRRLNHPNIVHPRAFARHEGQPFIAMDLVDGLPIDQALAPLPASPDRVVPVLRQLLDALATVHARGLVHRDLKPPNLLLGPDGHLAILDFGAVLLDEPDELGLVVENTAIGTASYVAPEVLRGAAHDGRADLYSLGCVAFELLTGTVPHRVEGGGPGAMAQVVFQPTPRVRELRPEIPDPVAAIVDRLLEKDSERRFAHAPAVLAALRVAGLIEGASHRSRRDAARVSSHAGEDLPFVGRTDAMLALRRGSERARAGAGTVLRAGGEPGCGLSRFLREARAYLSSRGWLALPDRPGDVLLPGAPGWPATTRALLDEAREPADSFGPLVVEWSGQEPREGGLRMPAEDFRSQRQAGLEGWLRLLAAAAARRPVALLVEDSERLDRPGRALAEHLAAGVPELSSRVFVVLGGDPQPQVHLRRLTAEEVESLFPERGLLGVDDQRAVRLLNERTHGTPALVADALSAWTHSGAVHAVPGGFAVSPKGRQVFEDPESTEEESGSSLDERYRHRIDEVDDEARRLLAAACQLDHPATPQVLARIAGFDEWEVLAPLDALLEARLLVDEGHGGGFRPLHPALGPLAREGLGTDEVRGLHLRAAEALADAGQPDAVLAVHLREGGRAAEAAAAWLRASHGALRAHDAASALEWARRAAALGTSPGDTWEAHRALARAALLVGDLGAAAASPPVLLEAPAGTPDADRVDGAVLAANLAMAGGNAAGAEAALQAAARAALSSGVLRGDVYLRRAQMYARSGRAREGEEQAALALECFRGVGARQGVARALHALASSLYRRGLHAQAAERAREAVRTWREPGERAQCSHSWHVLGASLADLGDLEGAAEAFDAARERFAEAGNLQALAYNRAATLELACRSGQPPIPLVQDVLRFASRLRLLELEAFAHLSLARVGGIEGTSPSAVRSGRKAAELFMRLGNRGHAAVAWARCALAEARQRHARAADVASERAAALLDESVQSDTCWQILAVRSWHALDPSVAREAGEEARRLAGEALSEFERGAEADAERDRMRELCRLRDVLGG